MKVLKVFGILFFASGTVTYGYMAIELKSGALFIAAVVTAAITALLIVSLIKELKTKKEVIYCPICGDKISNRKKFRITDGYVCRHCAHISTQPEAERIETLGRYWTVNNERGARFSRTKVLGNGLYNTVIIDHGNKLFYVGEKRSSITPIYYAFSEVVTYKILHTGGRTVSTSTVKPAGFFSTRDTIETETRTVDVKTSIKIYLNTQAGKKIVTLNSVPFGIQDFLDSCKPVQKMQDFFNFSNFSNFTTMGTGKGSGADEIVKYKELYDKGIITAAEFEAKKKQLLGI